MIKAIALFLLSAASLSFAGVTVSQPTAGASVGTSTRFVATAKSDTGWPISSILLYVDDVRVFSVHSSNLDTTQTLAPGTRNIALKSWDDSGKEYDKTFTLNVSATATSTTPSAGTTTGAITVSQPVPGSSVGTSVRFLANAQSQTGWPISSMLLYVDDVRVYTSYSSSLDTTRTLSTGTRKIAIKSWDDSGKEYDDAFTLLVGTATTTPPPVSTTTPPPAPIPTPTPVPTPTPIVTPAPAPTTVDGIGVIQPTAGSSVGTSVRFLANATSDTGYPISAILLYIDDVRVFTTYSSSLDFTKVLSTGGRNIAIKAWDDSGKEYDDLFTINVSSGVVSSNPTPPPPVATPPPTSTSAPANATVFSNIQALSDWQSCDACAGAGGSGPVAPYGLTQHVGSPSMDGNSSQYSIGGSTPYSDVLWWRTLIGSGEQSTNTNAHHFVYDLNYYVTDPSAPEAIEFDIDQYVSGRSLIFGSQCDYRGDDQWDVWDNVNKHWISTGISCGNLQANTWTHVVLEVERTSNNRLHYISLTLNGNKHYLDWYYDSTSTSWSGVDVNFQLDGNYRQQNYSVWVDKMSLTAW